MHSDSATLIGTDHSSRASPAQDWALAGSNGPDLPWGIIADGCSQGGMTDVGARIWALALRKQLQTAQGHVLALFDQPADLQAALLAQASPLLENLDFLDGLATLGAVCSDGARTLALLAGDGAVVECHADSSVSVIEYRYTENLPMYLNYLRFDNARAEFLARSIREGQTLEIQGSRYAADGSLLETWAEPAPALADLVGQCAIQVRECGKRAQPATAVFVATDGIFSRRGVDRGQAMQELFGLRNFNGVFAQRRLSKVAAGWSRSHTLPDDDLSVAGVYLGACA